MVLLFLLSAPAYPLELLLKQAGGVKLADCDKRECPAVPAEPNGKLGYPGMVKITAGKFWRGCGKNDKQCEDDEKPGREILLSEFWGDKHEVTAGEYAECVKSGTCNGAGLNPHDWCTYGKAGKSEHPINCVQWAEAKTYCESVEKRLPTEAEWEKAARGVDGRTYVWGEGWPPPVRVANLADTAAKSFSDWPPGWATIDGYNDGFGLTSPVCSFDASKNPNGLCDMAGNVWEWVADGYDKNFYASSPGNNPVSSSGATRVLRGASFNYNEPRLVRVSARYGHVPTYRSGFIGFRCVR